MDGSCENPQSRAVLIRRVATWILVLALSCSFASATRHQRDSKSETIGKSQADTFAGALLSDDLETVSRMLRNDPRVLSRTVARVRGKALTHGIKLLDLAAGPLVSDKVFVALLSQHTLTHAEGSEGFSWAMSTSGVWSGIPGARAGVSCAPDV